MRSQVSSSLHSQTLEPDMYEALSPNRGPEKQPKERLVYKSTLTLPIGVGSPPLFCANYLFAGLFSLGFGPQWQGLSVYLCILSD